MTYLPFVGVCVIAGLVVLGLRLPARRPYADARWLRRARVPLSVVGVGFSVWGCVQLVQDGTRELRDRQLVEEGERGDAVVSTPLFGRATTRAGGCTIAHVELVDDGDVRAARVEVRSAAVGQTIPVAFDPSARGSQRMVPLDGSCRRAVRAPETGVAVLLIAGVCIALRRGAPA